ncbi:hypothetical protein EBI_25681 [Enterocytozoon bieneusi H348]|nr:hypothetical protein EBI_25681 [Enterocytozoon bieneusi H348]|eukprot:XP_002651107.1 hypothetical protein EBI_25681 [Enterocytozoon bieneusi H348]
MKKLGSPDSPGRKTPSTGQSEKTHNQNLNFPPKNREKNFLLNLNSKMPSAVPGIFGGAIFPQKFPPVKKTPE